VSKYRSYIIEKFDSHNEAKKDYGSTHFDEIVKRSIHRIKPISPKGEEFRDTLLWLIVLETVEQHRHAEVAFISNNLTDFGNDTKDGLHPDLISELKAKELNLLFFESLKKFSEKIAVKIEFITDEWLIKNIDWEGLERRALKDELIEKIIYSGQFLDQILYESDIDEDSFDTWRPAKLSFDRSAHFMIIESSIQNGYEVGLYLSGTSDLQFMKNNKVDHVAKVNFHTNASVIVSNDEYLSFDSFYVSEESSVVPHSWS
ncbi:MAG: PIN domain-containing protein, partial [Bacteroidota bacterium]